MNAKITVPDVLERFIAYRRKHPVWGSLHVVLEDGNVSDADVRYCAVIAERDEDGEGKALAELLLKLSRTQRCRVATLATHQVDRVEALA